MLGNLRGGGHFCGSVKKRPRMPYLLPEFKSPLQCLECGSPLGYGRHDRKFCSPNCKNRWHNERRYPGRDRTVARVLKILDTNRDILAKLLRMGIREMDRRTLLQLGFRPEYATSFQWSGRRRQFYGCYDYSYELTPSRIKRISRWVPEGLQEGAVSKGKTPVSGRAVSSGDL